MPHTKTEVIQNRGNDDEVERRLDKLEKHEFENTLTLVEILSNLTFFGSLRMKECPHSKQGQCGLFFLRKEATKKIPIATDCRIKGCKEKPDHCHIELSKVTCALCPSFLVSENHNQK